MLAAVSVVVIGIRTKCPPVVNRVRRYARDCGCPKPAHMSCDVLIIVEESTDAVVSVDLADPGRGAAGEWL